MKRKDISGIGVLLNPSHLKTILELKPQIDWFELTSEHLLGVKSSSFRPRISKDVELLLASYPVTLHGLELSIGSVDALDRRYLKSLRELENIIKPAYVSDHMVWTGALGYKAHCLIPFPYTDESFEHVADRIAEVQDFLGRQFLIENPPGGITYKHSTYTEFDFMTKLAKKTGCGLLIDLNNLYVSATNNDFDPRAAIGSLRPADVHQFHLAGSQKDSVDFMVDTHEEPVLPEVWALYELALTQIGHQPANIEGSPNVTFGELYAESQKAKRLFNQSWPVDLRHHRKSANAA